MNMHIKTFIFLVFSLIYNNFAFAIGVSEPDFRSAAHCDSAEDYALSKQGVLGIGQTTLSIQNKKLTIKTQVIASQCTKLKNNRYQWKVVKPYGKIQYQHARIDFKNKTQKIDAITIERKKVWLSAINSSLKLVGKADVSGTMKTGFHATISFPVNTLLDSSQLDALNSGKSQNIQVGFFLKSLSRYIVDKTPTVYEESSGLGLRNINFIVRKVKGNITIIK
jgi:hypothetical protein